MVLRMVELGCHALRKEIRSPAMIWIRILLGKHRPRRFQALVHITNWAAGQILSTWISSQQKRKQHRFDAYRMSAPGQDLNIWIVSQQKHGFGPGHAPLPSGSQVHPATHFSCPFSFRLFAVQCAGHVFSSIALLSPSPIHKYHDLFIWGYWLFSCSE